MTKRMSTDEFVRKSNEIHNGKYTYNKTNLEERDENGKVIITCIKHGDFKQLPYKHLQGQGCKKCASELDSKRKTKTLSEFIEKAKKIHENKYIYSDYNFLTENEIKEFLSGFDLICNSKKILDSGKELDIFIPSKKIAIEFNGLRWHSEKYKDDKRYHIDKMNECLSKGIRLVQIFEDEYIHHKDIVLNKILHIIGMDSDKPRIMARKCIIKEINSNDAKIFLNKYHIQGFAPSSVYLGSYFNDNLIGVMSFKKENKCGKWELNRFSSDYNYVCQGIGGKLFKYFIKNYNPTYVKSFADKRWTTNKENNIYTKLGFTL